MKYREIKLPITEVERPRNSIAAGAWMPVGAIAPSCTSCGGVMQLFLQFDIDKKFSMPFKEGSHFILYVCSKCNEIPCFETCPDGNLPNKFWLKTQGHFFSALYPPEFSGNYLALGSVLKSFSLEYINDDGLEPETIKVGGNPGWLQAPENFVCQCGAPMHLICQVSENYRFPKLPSAPPQPDSFSIDDYCLFLGNEVYIFGCSTQCNERAVWITVQN